jgi:hypothetical protein
VSERPIDTAPKDTEVRVFLPWLCRPELRNNTGWYKGVLCNSRKWKDQYRWKVWLTPSCATFLQGAQPTLWKPL